MDEDSIDRIVNKAIEIILNKAEKYYQISMYDFIEEIENDREEIVKKAKKVNKEEKS